MKILRKIIEIDEELCDGCGQCVPACEEGAIEIVNGKAKLVAEKYCDGLGACMGDCPTGALRIVEREAEDFDEEAVEKYLEAKKADRKLQPDACGCPSSQFKDLGSTGLGAVAPAAARSLLGHWPVQIRLIPPHAPFLKNAHLLVAADCAAVACPDFHQRFVPGKVIMLGCPKFDDASDYVARFREIFEKNPISSISTVIMEVPCCSAMLGILKKAMEDSGRSFELRATVIGLKGNILREETIT